MNTLTEIISIIVAGVVSSAGTTLLLKYKRRKLNAEAEKIEIEAEGLEIDNVAKWAKLYQDLLKEVADMRLEIRDLKKEVEDVKRDYKEAMNENFILSSITNEALGCEHMANCPVLKRKKTLKRR